MVYFVGTAGPDSFNGPLDGPGEYNLVYGLGGDDELIGSTYIDVLSGGDGNDTIDGGDGLNYLYGDGGNDTINGGNDTDYIFGGAGNNRLSGNGGNDTIYGGNDSNKISGGDGDDYIVGGSGNDGINGNKGADILYGGLGQDSFIPGDYDAFPGGGYNTNESTDWIGDFNPVDDTLDVIDRYEEVNSTDDITIVATDAEAEFAEAVIVYSQGSGTLFYNLNSDDPGFGVTNGKLATLFGAPVLDVATNFI